MKKLRIFILLAVFVIVGVTSATADTDTAKYCNFAKDGIDNTPIAETSKARKAVQEILDILRSVRERKKSGETRRRPSTQSPFGQIFDMLQGGAGGAQGDINSAMNGSMQWQQEEAATGKQAKKSLMQEAIADAIPVYKQILKFAKFTWGSGSFRIARGLNFLSGLYISLGDYANAEESLLKAVSIMEKGYPDHYDTAAIMNNLGRLYAITDRHLQAEPLYLQALKIAKKHKELGPEHPDTAAGMQNLAALYFATGRYGEAEKFYQQALDVVEKKLGSSHSRTNTVRHNMAGLHTTLGDYDKAEALYEIIKNTGSEGSFLGKLARYHLAWLYYVKHKHDKAKRHQKDKLNELAKAEDLYKQLLKIYAQGSGSENDKLFIGTLNNLGVLYPEMGKQLEAEILLEETLKTSEDLLGTEAANTLQTRNNLGMQYLLHGDCAKAEPMLRQTFDAFKKQLDPEHITIGDMMQNLALLQVLKGEGINKETYEFVSKGQQIKEKNLEKILLFGSEQQRLNFQSRSYFYDLLAQVGNTVLLAEAVLHNKGVVLDSLMEDRRLAEASGDPEKQKIIEKILSTKRQLQKLLMTMPKDNSQEAKARRVARREALERELKEAESALASDVAGRYGTRWALHVKLEEVQGALTEDSVLVEFIRHARYAGKPEFESHYGAVIIPAGNKPQWVPLGEAKAIDKSIHAYRTVVRADNPDENALVQVLETLYKQVWKPIQQKLSPDTNTVVLSPDGQLNFLSFAALLLPQGDPHGDFLAEQFDIYYVTSGRDLLRKPHSTSERTMVVYANPAYRIDTSISNSTDGALATICPAYKNLSLDPLSNTKEEAERLKSMGKKQQWQVEPVLGTQATEAQLYKLRSPRILHLATHGFFLPEKNPQQAAKDNLPKLEQFSNTLELQLLNNPMNRGFVALAGAKTTIEAWCKHEPPAPGNDGILTAAEISGLKLSNTWLVTLSACDTGMGEAYAGEGVLGLRRGFIQAGTQNLLMTLWPIGDKTTPGFILRFYEKALETGANINAPKIFIDIQKKELLDIYEDKGLTKAIEIAGGFIMNFQGGLGITKK